MSTIATLWGRIRHEFTGSEESLRPAEWTAILALGAVVLLACLDDTFMYAVAGVIALCFLAPAARYLLVALLLVFMGCGVWMSERPISVVFFKVYGSDLIIPFLVWGTCFFAYRAAYNRNPCCGCSKQELFLSGLLLAYGIYGFVSMFYGLFFKGYHYDVVFGDFRRLCFYPMAFWLPFFLPLREKHLRLVKYAVLGGGCIVILFGVYRYATGQFWRVDEENVSGTVIRRLLADNEKLTLATLAAYCSAVLLSNTKPRTKLIGQVLLLLSVVFLFISGWRLAIVYAFTVPVAALVMNLWIRRLSFGRLITTVAVACAVAVIPVLLTPFLLPSLYNELMTTLAYRAQQLAVMGDERLWAWPQTLAYWYPNPIIGAGLGHQLVFYQRGSSGEFFYSMGSIHNEIISVLYQMGLIGITMFVLFHGYFVWLVLKHGRQTAPQYIPLLVGLFIGYLCSFGSSLLEPVRNSQYVVQYLMMALVLCILRFSGALGASPPRVPTHCPPS